MSATNLIQTHGKTVTVQRATTAVDNGGFPVQSYASVGKATVFIQVRSGFEAVRYGGERSDRFARGYAKAGVDIGVKDRLIWGSRTFEVTSAFSPGEFGSEPGHLVLDLEELD